MEKAENAKSHLKQTSPSLRSPYRSCTPFALGNAQGLAKLHAFTSHPLLDLGEGKQEQQTKKGKPSRV